MKKVTDDSLTKLADAAFEQAARKAVARAVDSRTPVIVCVNEKMKVVKPRAVRSGRKRTRPPVTKN